MKSILRWTLLCGFCVSATIVRAASDDSYVEYDAIVNELKASAEEEPKLPSEDFNWDDVALVAGMSIATSYVTVDSPNGANGTGLLKGFEIHGGMNLFTKSARGEFAFRHFTPESLGGAMNAELKEFEARLMFLPYLRDRLNMRMGFGLGARYMDINARGARGWESFEASTPTSAMILGMERKLSRDVSVGPDFAYRSRLATGTFDKSSWDAVIRLNATF